MKVKQFRAQWFGAAALPYWSIFEGEQVSEVVGICLARGERDYQHRPPAVSVIVCVKVLSGKR